MPSTERTGSIRGQRYRPASEFDDATLAQKREYWRNKKREQRAKLSEVKTVGSKARNRGSKSLGSNAVHQTLTSMPLNSSGSCSVSGSAPPLLNSDGSYQTNVAGAPLLLLKGKSSDESYQQNYSVEEGDRNSSRANQKERWFQRIKLNKVLPQSPTSDGVQEKGAMVCKMAVKSSSTGEAVIRNLTSAKPNGVLLDCGSPTTPGKVEERSPGSSPFQPESEITFLNGSSPIVVAGQHLVTQCKLMPDVLTKTQVTVHVQPRQVTTNVSSQPNPVLIHKAGSRPRGMKVTPLGGKSSALVMAQGTKSINCTATTGETEEERAAKRRESWRIKKREQRAKQAAKLKKAADRTKNVEISLQKAALLPNAVIAHPLSGQGQKQCVRNVRATSISDGRLLKNVRAVATVAVKTETEDSAPTKLSAVGANPPNMQLKVENPQEAKEIMQTPVASNIIGYKPSRSLPGPVQFTSASRGMVRCRTPRQRFIETQSNLMGQRNLRRLSSNAMAFTTWNALKQDPTETPEQMAVRKREYWRVKKREQRAKLSVEVKTKMKERDGLLRRVKRYQSILEDMRKARMAGCNPLSQLTGNRPSHTSASETIGGFIKEDGTLTNNISQINLTADAKEDGGGNGGMCVNDSFTNAHHQRQLLPKLSGETSSNTLVSRQIRVNPPPLIRPTQVRVSCPLIGLSIPKPPRLISIKPRTEFHTASSSQASVQPRSHITLTHPQNFQNTFSGVPAAISNPASCVMKMAVKATTASVLNLDPTLTEEERMAKKREYWRVKKREQRAARANRLRQGAQARGIAASQKRRNQRLARLAAASPNVNTSVNNPLSLLHPQGHQIKQERELTSEEPPCLPLELERVDIKPSLSPTLEPQLVEPTDQVSSVDSQATTLLAVASMKKLLEESLSTVADCKTEQPDCITEQLSCKREPQGFSSEEAEAQLEVKPDLPLLTLGDTEKVSISADLSLEVKGWQVDATSLQPCQDDFPAISHSKDYPLSSATETLSFPEPPLSGYEPSSDTHMPPHVTGPEGPLHPYPRRAQRLRAKKTGHHNCCSPEPPKLHHQPLQQQQQQQQQQQLHTPHQQGQNQYHFQSQIRQIQKPAQQQQQHHRAPSGSDQNVTQKREYWRIMKRQQRARKARQGGGSLRQGDYSRRLTLKAAQDPNHLAVKTPVSQDFSLQPAPFLKPQASPLLRPISPPGSEPQESIVPTIPSLLVMSPAPSNMGPPSEMLQLKPPANYASISGSPAGQMASPPTHHSYSTVSLPAGDAVDVPAMAEGKKGSLLLVESQPEAAPGSSPESPRVRKWRLHVQETPEAKTLPVVPLSPPANPLNSIKMLAVQPPAQTSSFTPTHTPFPCAGVRVPQSINNRNGQSPSTQGLIKSPAYICSMGPPKPVPGETEEETLRKKREYWRVKKKEQRARKSMRDRELTEKRASVHWRTILPSAQTQHLLPEMDMQEQDSGQWLNSSQESEMLLSTSTETDMGYFPDSSHTEPVEDESELRYLDDGTGESYNGPISDAVWRNHYLMDYDPLNQLLVCMVCGELQYSHSLEGVRAHIEDAHPDTLSLDAPEHRRILEAWDEQVSRRERFFTSQLQHHTEAMGGD
ncbi:hypothetical protein UPYG_G00241750 [Umbra pygmaea]|uniref:SPIN-DOC-like zinc-finger domain-containing protein n=1 Tax=Umbra pygmaea TaxID=75934 RepID=A0ABD0X5Z5_UMBPY